MPRFWQAPGWRHLITDRDGVTQTFLDRLLTGGEINYDLNTPSKLTGVVPSANPEVNIPALAPDDDPFLSEGTRFCYSFRRDGSGNGNTAPWGVRHSGIVSILEDEGDPDTARSTMTVTDPWQYLYSRPCVDDFGNLPGTQGLNFLASPAADIALALLANTISNHGPVGIDAGIAYGGTALYGGFLANDTDTVDYNVSRGKTVGEAWEDLCALALMDIELVPIYDPAARPDYLSELNIYRSPWGLVTQPRGEARPNAIFSWDKPPRTLSGITRALDGQSRANSIMFYNRKGVPAGLLTDPGSITKYGEYWYEQQFPDQSSVDRVANWAQAQLELRSWGMRTITPVPSPQQPPLLWEEFFVGDRVPVYASHRLREPIPEANILNLYYRVIGITLSLDPEEQMTEVRVINEPILPA